jgi:hypothetical protein
MNVLKFDFDFNEAIFHDDERSFELILWFKVIEKSTLTNLLVMFYVGEWPLELIICLLDVFKNEFV